MASGFIDVKLAAFSVVELESKIVGCLFGKGICICRHVLLWLQFPVSYSFLTIRISMLSLLAIAHMESTLITLQFFSGLSYIVHQSNL